MWKIILLILAAEVWNTAGQIFFKKSANSFGVHNFQTVGGWANFMKDVFSSSFIWLGFLSMVAGLAIWLAALSRADLSFVFPVGSLQYIFILISAYIFLGEKMDKMKLAGTLLVVLGITLIALS